MIDGSALLRSSSPTGCSVFLPIICTVVLYCLRVCLRAVRVVHCACLAEGFGALYALDLCMLHTFAPNAGKYCALPSHIYRY